MLINGPGARTGVLPQSSQAAFIANNLEDKEAEKREFEREGLNLNYVDGSKYLGDYLGPRAELEAWVWPKMEAWAHEFRILVKIAKWYTQLAYARLGMLI